MVKQINDCYTKILELKVYDTMIKLWPEKLELILIITAPEGASILRLPPEEEEGGGWGAAAPHEEILNLLVTWNSYILIIDT